MIFYNPFKWHVTKSGDRYFVRRWFFKWLYIDAEDVGFDWPSRHRDKYCVFASLESARRAISNRHEEIVK